MKTDTPNWDTHRNHSVCSREELSGGFSHMEPESCFRLRQRSSVLDKEFGEPLLTPACTSSADEKRKILLLKVMVYTAYCISLQNPLHFVIASVKTRKSEEEKRE